MTSAVSVPSANPVPSAGIGLKPEHYRPVLEAQVDGLWLEIHPENYMEAGGPRLDWLTVLAETHDLSFHGVGLSLGGVDRPDPDHLKRWTRLMERVNPVRVSEHLAWSAHAGVFFNDLLPVQMTRRALDRFADHVDIMQQALGRQVLIENPSRYIDLPEELPEAEFLAETVERTGCGLLLDVNNLYVTARNMGWDLVDDINTYLATLPLKAVGELHLAGHEADSQLGEALLVDTHGAPVPDPVWSLCARVLARTGPKPVLIERDNDIPSFDALLSERDRAQSLLDMLSEPLMGRRHA